jgi:hypothetical protein
MRLQQPVQAVFNAIGAHADAGRVLRAATVIAGAVALFLTIVASLAPRAAVVP